MRIFNHYEEFCCKRPAGAAAGVSSICGVELGAGAGLAEAKFGLGWAEISRRHTGPRVRALRLGKNCAASAPYVVRDASVPGRPPAQSLPQARPPWRAGGGGGRSGDRRDGGPGRDWSQMEPIEEWLQTLGLPQYAPTFVEADIDPSVLPDLTEADLERLGVTLGHRKKLLRAIAARSEGATKAPPAPAAAAVREAERRQVTVMFCDLVGSTALSVRLDPEDLREVIGAYHRGVAEAVRRFDGFVAKYMGDGVLVYFGYPAAHEDDAERAVRAGLALTDAVPGLAAPEPLQVRIGNRDRPRGGRRPRRRGRGPGARDRRRDAEPRCPPSGVGRTRHGGDRRRHAPAARRSFQPACARPARAQGLCRAGRGLGGRGRLGCREPVRNRSAAAG